ncbi:Importin subunit beta-1 [Hondaea fermentalgiana]|uniref:Importin subunit beta-1 n=1 Tax=Hondaea fermentalgiana TaxID=2315210 RepID=A0A2R5G525_9STRA|nr:Importin subunit beta-1 [Hondaea fermentalgiana]|eukprot:GBG25439.1 Importin subunit beta-1 [Hondaea fermentalgiana]
MDNLTQILLATQENDVNVRGPAEKSLADFEQNNFPQYLVELAKELGNDGKPENSRTIAALQMKRILTGNDDLSARRKHEQWSALAPEAKAMVKQIILQVLATATVNVAKQAAQVVEAVAKFELPADAWNELPAQLVQAFDQAHSRDASQIVGPLLGLGYFSSVAVDVGFGVGEDAINQLLSKISVGMSAQMPKDVQVAATEALSDTLDFAKHNMENEQERRVIMEMILRMTQSPHPEAREHAFQCLTTVLELYYDHLKEHMQEIWERTTEAIRNVDEESVAQQALNFWSEMAYEETERKRENDPGSPCYDFVVTVQEPLCKLVLDFCLLQQDEEPDEDESSENTLYGAAEHCFVNLCTCLGPSIRQYAMQFTSQNIVNPDWRRRQAAIFAFGAVLRDASSSDMSSAINEIMVTLLQRMLPTSMNTNQEPEPVATVRETAAWAVSLICSSHIAGVTSDNVRLMVGTIFDALNDKPRVAHMAAAAVYAFAGAFQDQANQQTNALSGDMMQKFGRALWDAARRQDSHQWQLMEDAYEALMRLIEVSAKDMRDFVGRVLLHTSLVRLGEIRDGKVHDQTGFQEVELCGVVSMCIVKLEDYLLQLPVAGAAQGEASPHAVPDEIMKTMIAVLNRPGSNAHADALGAIGEVTRIVGPSFTRYLEAVVPLVFRGLQTRENSQVCIAAVRLCADVCTALKDQPQLVQLTPQLMQYVYDNLGSDDLQSEVKPPHLTILGDIADAVGPKNFQPYFPTAMHTAISACNVSLDVTEAEFADDLNNLREAALEAMELMLLDVDATALHPFLEQIYNLACSVSLELRDARNYYQNKDPSIIPPDLASLTDIPYKVADPVVKSVLNILGDVAKTVGQPFREPLRNNMNNIAPLVQYAKQHPNQDLVEAADYAAKQISA